MFSYFRGFRHRLPRKGAGMVGTTYTVLTCSQQPKNGHVIVLTVNGKELRATLPAINYGDGQSFTYLLTVGKDKLLLSDVQVADWTGSGNLGEGIAL